MRCPYDCYSCLGDGRCISCNATTDFRQLSTTTNRCTPIIGYYESFAQASYPCPAGCSECSSPTLCTACLTGFLLNSSRLCSDTCALRYYPDYAVQSCQPCPYDCLTCNANGGCLSCSGSVDFRVLINLTNRCVPLPGYFDNFTSVSVACTSGCLKC